MKRELALVALVTLQACTSAAPSRTYLELRYLDLECEETVVYPQLLLSQSRVGLDGRWKRVSTPSQTPLRSAFQGIVDSICSYPDRGTQDLGQFVETRCPDGSVARQPLQSLLVDHSADISYLNATFAKTFGHHFFAIPVKLADSR